MSGYSRLTWVILIIGLLRMVTSPVGVGAIDSATGQTIYVSSAGSDDNQGSSRSDPFGSLQAAVDSTSGPITIVIAAGTYDPFEIVDRSDIRIQTDGEVRIVGADYDSGAAILIRGSRRVEVLDLEVLTSLWGVRIESSDSVTLRGLHVHDTGQEAIAISKSSSFVEVLDSTVHDTGNRPGSQGSIPFSHYGEGIYVGTGFAGVVDETHDVLLARNNIFDTSSEAIDIKPNAYNVTILDNWVHDLSTSTSGAITVGIGAIEYRSANVLIRGNYVWNISRTSSWSDGIGIHLSASAVVEQNVIWSTQHWGILLDSDFVGPNKTVVIRQNAVFGTGRSEIGQWATASPVAVEISDNLLSSEVAHLLTGQELTAQGAPSRAVAELQMSLSQDSPASETGGSTTTSTLNTVTSIPDTATPEPIATTPTTITSNLATTSSTTITSSPVVSPSTAVARSTTDGPLAVVDTPSITTTTTSELENDLGFPSAMQHEDLKGYDLDVEEPIKVEIPTQATEGSNQTPFLTGSMTTDRSGVNEDDDQLEDAGLDQTPPAVLALVYENNEDSSALSPFVGVVLAVLGLAGYGAVRIRQHQRPHGGREAKLSRPR